MAPGFMHGPHTLQMDHVWAMHADEGDEERFGASEIRKLHHLPCDRILQLQDGMNQTGSIKWQLREIHSNCHNHLLLAVLSQRVRLL